MLHADTKLKFVSDGNWAAEYAHLLATHPFFASVRMTPAQFAALPAANVELARLPSSAIAAIAVAPIASEFT